MPKYVGASVRRKEDHRLLTGQGRFVADLRAPAMVEAAVLRSSYAHALIKRIDTTEALALEGVLAVFTAADLRGKVEPFTRMFYKGIPAELAETVRPVVKPFFAPLLADDRVRRVGEPVAVVVAVNRYVAEDALERIEVEYEPLPVIADPEAAIAPGAPVLHPEFGDNIHCHFVLETGDVEQAFADADFRLGDRFRLQREVGSPMETRSLLATFEPHHKQLTLWANTQLPHQLRTYLSEMLHLAEDNIRVTVPDMGGSFGGNIYNEDILIPFIAMQLGRPVRWVEDRLENLGNARHGRDQVHTAELAFNRDGRIVGLRTRYLVDVGCYNPFGFNTAYNTASHMRNEYLIENFRAEGLCVLTNKTPNTPIRGAGRPEATFVLERLIEMAAEKLQMDPAELRRRNLIPAASMPYDVGVLYRDGRPFVYDSGDFPAQFEQALAAIDYPALRAQQAVWQAEGRRIGIGLAGCVEGTGFGPHEGAVARLDPTGQVLIYAGCTPHGQSHETTLSQVAADELGVTPDQVTVRAGDTALLPYGGGTFASRSGVTAGAAVTVAGRRLREKILAVAGHLMEVSPHDLSIDGGSVFVKGMPGKAIDFRQIAAATAPGPACRLPEGMEPGSLVAEYYFVPPAVTVASSSHVALVEVDENTGAVQVLRYLIVHDAGQLINPLVVDGQIHGAVAHGIGSAMFEEVVHDQQGQVLTSTFMDYLLPTASDVPRIEVAHQEFLSPLNPLGIKGCGEGGTTGPPAAIANAIADALKPLKISITELPMQPGRIWQAIQTAKRQAAAAQ